MLKWKLALGSLLVSSTALANIHIYSNFLMDEDFCRQLNGTWNGKGTVVADIKITKITCQYHGTALFNPGANGNFSVDINLTKDSGICPSSESLSLSGTCQNSAITINTTDADLTGKISNSGRSADLDGKIWFSVLGKRVCATVKEMQLQKA